MITFTLSGAQFSDLFFNYIHPMYDLVMARCRLENRSVTKEELESAVFKDASDFVSIYEAGDPHAMTKDFLKRL